MTDLVNWWAVRRTLDSAERPVTGVPTESTLVHVTAPDAITVPHRRRPGIWAAYLLVGLLIVGLAGAAVWGLTRPGDITVHGTVTLAPAGQSCSGTGYADIHQGVQVTVTDEHGTILGVGTLTPGASCQWLFVVDGVPAGHRWYGVSIAARGRVQFTEAQLRAGPTLGLR